MATDTTQTENQISSSKTSDSSSASTAPLRGAGATRTRASFESFDVWIQTASRTFVLTYNSMLSRIGFEENSQVSLESHEIQTNGPTKEAQRFYLSQEDSESASTASLSQDLPWFSNSQCSLSASHTQGNINSRSQDVHTSWDIKFKPAHVSNTTPFTLFDKGGLNWQTLSPVVELQGKIQIGSEAISLDHATGVITCVEGSSRPHSWNWAHCHQFLDSNGKEADFYFEGLSARIRLTGNLSGRKRDHFVFKYQGVQHSLAAGWAISSVKSSPSLSGWTFEANSGELTFKGELQTEYRNYLGTRLLDTTGSPVYVSRSGLAKMTVHVFRNGKIESSFTSGNVLYEVGGRTRPLDVRIFN